MQSSAVTLNQSVKTCNLCAVQAFQMEVIIFFSCPCIGCRLLNIYDALGCWRECLLLSVTPRVVLASLAGRSGNRSLN